MTSASIITIGDELLIGQVVDTNSAWIAQQLNSIGIAVTRRVAVGDVWKDIWNALDQESNQSELILITGGLGPTSDDITKPLLCEYFGGTLTVNAEVLENIQMLFQQVFKRPATESNLKQAEVPDVCEVIQNKRGTAPGMWFEKNDCLYISMPGVPFEMKGMIEEILPRLSQRYTLPTIIHKTVVTFGVGETFLSDRISEFEADLPADIKLAYLPSFGMVRLRLSLSDFDKQGGEKRIEDQFKKLITLIKEFIVSEEDEPMEKIVARLLISGNQTMATAESCTGGHISQLMTSHAGASAYFKGCVVSYDNEVKENVLKVPAETLATEGAVSESTVNCMLQGLLNLIKCDVGIAVSGIMGPSGGTEDKPVGTVWMAAGTAEKTLTKKLSLRFDRQKNIEVTAIMALDLLRRSLVDGDAIHLK